jgi:PAS domain S-box-containing protein
MERTKLHDSQYASSLIEASLDPLITISIYGKITDMNQAKVNITGRDRNELIGTDFSAYFTDTQKAHEVYMKVFAEGSVTDSPLTFIHKNGKLTDVLFNGSVYKDKKGNVLGAVVVARDISKQKWVLDLQIANKELEFQNEEKEKRADELIIANKELSFQNHEKEDRADELIIANKELAFQNEEKEKRAAELLLANKELIYQNEEKEKRAAELIIANKELAFQNEEKEKRAAELLLANKELIFQNIEKEKRAAELIIANKELAFQNKEKEKRAAELVLANKELAFQNLVKEKRAAELIIADKELLFQIREKQKQEIANIELEAISDNLKMVSQYSLSLIEASLDPLITINAAGKITDMNEALVKITGLSRKELTGSDFFDYFTERQKAREVYQEVFAKGSVADSPLTICHKNGKLTDVLFNGSVYKNDLGKVIGVVVVARDITDQKRIATELMEAIVFAELAVAIAEEAKLKAESATLVAENAVKAKQQFLSNMSHEIRTPMNAIIGFTKVLLKMDTTSRQKEYLQAIKVSGDALIVLINDILDLA